MINYLNHFTEGKPHVKEKFLCKFFIDVRPENSHFKIGDAYSHFVDGKYETFAKIVNINFKYLDVFPEHISLLCYGLNQADAQEYVKQRFSRTQGGQRINFKDKRLAVLTFEKCEPPKTEQLKL